jgi:hypothetical protein
MPRAAEPRSRTSLREKLIKIDAKVVSHGCYVTSQMAEVAVLRQMFAAMSLIGGCGHRPPRMSGVAKMLQTTRGRHDSIQAKGRVSASRCPEPPIRSPFAGAGHDLPLPRSFNGAILGSKPPGPGECRLRKWPQLPSD